MTKIHHFRIYIEQHLVFIILILFHQIHLQQTIIVDPNDDEIRVGILMKHLGLEEPLNRTLEMLNENSSILPNIKVKAITEIIETDNSYQISAAGKFR